MNTKKWGPSAWFFLHTITFNYPEKPTVQDKQHYSDLFENLKHTLPCIYCRESYTEFLKRFPVSGKVLESRENLTKWFYNIHNLVNDKLRTQYYTNKSDHYVYDNPKYKDVCAFYERYRANCGHKKMTCSSNK